MLLLERLMATEGSRVVNVSSVAHKIKSKLDPATMMSGEKYDRIAAYGRSKLANLLFTYELQRRLEAADSTTAALAAHPGVSSTELGPQLAEGGADLDGALQRSDRGSQPPRARSPSCELRPTPIAVGGEYYGPDGFMEGRGNPVVVRSSERSHDDGPATGARGPSPSV